MAVLIQQTVDECVDTKPVIVQVGRHTLYKRRWRAKAADGTELAVNLDAPVDNGTLLGSEDGAIYLIEQTKEDVIVVPLPGTTEMAAQLGWYLGNQHLPVEVRSDSIVIEHVKTLVAALDRIGIPYTLRTEVFHCKMHSHQH
ncbi:MAG: urease accessory protein UreE [Akkermansiaceae bacterium]